jgi:membrane-associated protein
MHIWQLILDFDAHLPQLVAMHANLVYFILFGVVFLQIGVLPFFFCPATRFYLCAVLFGQLLHSIFGY